MSRLLLTLTLTGAAFAQNPVSDAIRSNYAAHKRNLLEAVEKIPETHWGWRPKAEVMTFAEQVAHIAASNYSDCSILKSEPNPYQARKVETKPEVAALIKASFEYCDPAVAALADASLPDKVARGQREVPKASAGVHLLWHPSLHYGNLITYMRLRDIVPPETERAQTAAPSATATATPAGAQLVTYYMVFLKRGPAWTPQSTPETQRIQQGHMDHMGRMAREGKLVLAGPFGDDGELRGIQLYRAASLEEAKQLATQDPAVAAGRFAVEIHPWLTMKGVLP